MLKIQNILLKNGSMFHKLKLIGKDMDENETKTFIMLVDEIKERQTQFGPQYSLFCKFDDSHKDEEWYTEDAFTLELSGQAHKELTKYEIKKGMRFTVSKEFYENKKTGAMMPAVRVEVSGSTPSSTNGNDKIEEMFNTYIETAPEEKRSLNHFVGTAIRTLKPDIAFVKKCEELWNKQ